MRSFFPRISFLSSQNPGYGLSAFLIAILVAMTAPHAAFADGAAAPSSAVTLSDVIVNACNFGLLPFTNVLVWTAYTAGAFFTVSAVLMLAKHYENPNHAPMQQIIARFTGAALLLVMPSVCDTLIGTLFMDGGSASTAACVAGTAPATTATDPSVWVTNFLANITTPLGWLAEAVASILGILFITRGLLKASKYGTDPKTTSITVILSNFIVGAILLASGSMLDTMLTTMFGTGYDATKPSVASWAAVANLGDTSGTIASMITYCLTFFQIIGFISFVRGWKIVKDAAEGSGQATMAQGLTHIIGGVMACNIFNVLEIIDNTIGQHWLT